MRERETTSAEAEAASLAESNGPLPLMAPVSPLKSGLTCLVQTEQVCSRWA